MELGKKQCTVPVDDRPEKHSTPHIVWVIVLATLMSNLTGEAIFGFQVSGFGWFIPLIFALYVLVTTTGKSGFPYWIWIPWFALTIGYLLFASAENSLQRTVMLLTPMIVGIAVSKVSIRRSDLLNIEQILDKFSIVFFIAILVNSGFVLTGALPDVTGLAPQATTAALFGTFFAAKYASGNNKAAIKWLLFAAVPVIAVTRAAMLAVGLTLPLTFAPLNLVKRIVILVCVAVLGFMVFNTERVQNKMFYSGVGTVSDLSFENPDFATSGRIFIKEAMDQEIITSPWFGYGANASEQFVAELTGGLTHPHDDYLRLAFDYGYVGMFVFIFCMILQMLHALRVGYMEDGITRLFLLTGAGAFIPFAMFMTTDNIILYAAFFGNLHFMMMGAGYAVLVNKDKSASAAGMKFK